MKCEVVVRHFVEPSQITVVQVSVRPHRPENEEARLLKKRASSLNLGAGEAVRQPRLLPPFFRFKLAVEPGVSALAIIVTMPLHVQHSLYPEIAGPSIKKNVISWCPGSNA
jgi:hypothetical protein